MADYSTWDYRQLQRECKERHLKAKAKKAVLIAQLIRDDAKNKNTNENDNSNDIDDGDDEEEEEDEEDDTDVKANSNDNDDDDHLYRRQKVLFSGTMPVIPNALYVSSTQDGELKSKPFGIDTGNFIKLSCFF